jgi:hypothetical protein
MLSILMIIVGAGSLAVAAQAFTVVRGKVTEKGVASYDFGDGRSYTTQTVSVLIENNDRVFRIERGTVVKYALSDSDALRVDVGSDIELLVTSYHKVARVIGLGGSNIL